MKILNRSRCALCIAAFLLSGCGGNQSTAPQLPVTSVTSIGAPGAMPQMQANRQGALGTAGAAPERQIVAEAKGSESSLSAAPPATNPSLYVLDTSIFYYGTVTAYAPGKTKPKRTISQGLNYPYALAFDGRGYLYVANCGRCNNHGNDTVTVYAPGNNNVLRTISLGLSRPLALVVDDAGNLFVANVGNNTVTVYAPGSNNVLRTISKGVNQPVRLAVGKSDDLYVANCGSVCNPSGSGNSRVTVYAPGSTKVQRTISQGVNWPLALAFDRSENLYVANSAGNTVTVYAAGKTRLIRTISQGVDDPESMVFDGFGNLYVANLSGNTVTVYAPGSKNVLRTVSQGTSPQALAFGSRLLYVANSGCTGPYCHPRVHSHVTVYAHGGLSHLRNIYHGVNDPIALAFGP